MFEQESLQNESMEKYIWNHPLEHPKVVSTKWEIPSPFFGQNPARHRMMVYAGHVPTHFVLEISRGMLIWSYPWLMVDGCRDWTTIIFQRNILFQGPGYRYHNIICIYHISWYLHHLIIIYFYARYRCLSCIYHPPSKVGKKLCLKKKPTKWF